MEEQRHMVKVSVSDLLFLIVPTLARTYHRLIEWLLHRLEMALPQPVLHGKAAEQVSGSQAEATLAGWW